MNILSVEPPQTHVSNDIKRIILEYTVDIYKAVSPNLSIEALEWFRCIMNLGREIYMRNKSFNRACRFNKFEHAEWYAQIVHFDREHCLHNRNFKKVCDTLNNEFIKWFVITFNIQRSDNNDQSAKLSKHGNLDIIKWLYDRDIQIYFICSNSNVDVVLWALSKYSNHGKYFQEVCRSGHLDAIKMLEEVKCDFRYNQGIEILCLNGYSDAFDWCDKNIHQIPIGRLIVGLYGAFRYYQTSIIDKILNLIRQRHQDQYERVIKELLA